MTKFPIGAIAAAALGFALPASTAVVLLTGCAASSPTQLDGNPVVRAERVEQIHATGPKPNSASDDVRASQVVGTDVESDRGVMLGRVAGVLIDTTPRGQHYALLETDACSGGEKRFAYPVNALRREGSALRLPVPRDNLAQSPGYEGNRWPAPGARSGGRYVLARELVGRPVLDPLGRQVGVLRDVSIDLNTARTRFVVIDFADGGTLPMPAHAVRLSPEGPATLDADSHRRS